VACISAAPRGAYDRLLSSRSRSLMAKILRQQVNPEAQADVSKSDQRRATEHPGPDSESRHDDLMIRMPMFAESQLLEVRFTAL
jgi:hypothetical protein